MNTAHCPKTGQFTFKQRNLYLTPLRTAIAENPNGIIVSPAPTHPKIQTHGKLNDNADLALRSLGRAYSILPQAHFNRLKSIQACAGKDIPDAFVLSTKDKRKQARIKRALSNLQRRFSAEGGSLTGGYVWDTHDILVVTDAAISEATRSESTGATLVGTALHEVGHNVYNNLSVAHGDVTKHIHTMHEQRKQTGNYITAYAAESPVEYFAEGYSLYVHSPRYLKARDPELYTVLNVMVFGGVTYNEASHDTRRRKVA